MDREPKFKVGDIVYQRSVYFERDRVVRIVSVTGPSDYDGGYYIVTDDTGTWKWMWNSWVVSGVLVTPDPTIFEKVVVAYNEPKT